MLNWVIVAAVCLLVHTAAAQKASPGPAMDGGLPLRAELLASGEIRLLRGGDVALPMDTQNYQLRSAQGTEVAIRAVHEEGSHALLLVPARDIDIRRVYYLHLLQQRQVLLCRFTGWLRTLSSDKELGAWYEEDSERTWVRVFSPRADSVRLYLYRARRGAPPALVHALRRDSSAVWEIALPGNYEGWWYDFTVHGPDDPGNEFHEQHPVHVTDPYARVSDDSFGRARIWPRMTAPPPLRGGIPVMEDVIAYEVHVEDFTLALPGLDPALRGSFAGFAQSGLRNGRGEAVGFDYLVDLGINVVHLMPVQEFLHYPDHEWQQAFAGNAYMREQMVDSSNYQWGYRTTHALALESRYRRKGSEIGSQNRDFRELVAAFHEKDIAVIVDLVFNHTGERMDGREMYFNFRVFGRHAYYRTDDALDFIGAYGTETKSEERPMTARWIYDQCRMLIEEYGVDGFRIDLAGLTDQQTLEELRRLLGPEIIIYGEPWIASSDPEYEANPEWDWYKEDAPITFFQDDTRNALCGPPDNPENKFRDRGYAGGNGMRDAARQAIANSFLYEDNPNEGINYLDIHDNWALADRFAVEDWNGLRGVEEARVRIAAAMLLTSLGPVVIHGGTEMLRSKGSTPLVNLVEHTASGPIYIHGRRDTYNLRRPNLFLWESLGRNIEDGAACNFERMKEYWKGLIRLRRSDAGKVLRVGHAPPDDYIQWILPDDPMLMGYVVDGRIAVLVNTGTQAAVFENVILPDGRWELVVAGDAAGSEALLGEENGTLHGGEHRLRLDALDARIWILR
ncbi:MAG: alpha-amylase family glycosyl hydrolase [Bacteroidota bacterium]|nr:alpha-amylase family glycosyl hydrolase [Bacteroidota bacterium]